MATTEDLKREREQLKNNYTRVKNLAEDLWYRGGRDNNYRNKLSDIYNKCDNYLIKLNR